MRQGNGRSPNGASPNPLTVLWVSDAPWHATGYGITTDHIVRRMAKDGHRVFVYGPGGFFGGKIEYAPNITVLSCNFGDDRWGNYTINTHVQATQPDVIITWLDCQGLGEYGWDPTPVFMWTPVDTWPVQSTERAILGRAERLLVPSRWGQDVLAGHDMKSDYVPCGIDLSLYDIDAQAGADWRKKLEGITEDTFLIGMVGLNSGAPDRKGYGYAFDIIKEFSSQHPDVKAYIHSNFHGDGQAINLQDLRFEMDLLDTIFFLRPSGSVPLPAKYLKGVYNGIDVFMHCGNSEGFGIPVVEAQACGTPVVANACTAVTELLGSSSIGCEPLGDMILQPCTRIALPSVKNMLEGLETMYERWKKKEIDPHAVRSEVLQYEQDAIYDNYWRDQLRRVPQPIRYSEYGERKLLLAAGKEHKPGWTHHDRERFLDHIDVAHDLNVFPWPWEDDSFDYIEFPDCLEHLRASLPDVMEELWRILAPGGYVFIHTAEAGSWQLNMDPTHTQGFYLDSLDYFDPETRRGKAYSYSKKHWRVVRKTEDDGGLIFVMQPRKEALVPA